MSSIKCDYTDDIVCPYCGNSEEWDGEQEGMGSENKRLP